MNSHTSTHIPAPVQIPELWKQAFAGINQLALVTPREFLNVPGSERGNILNQAVVAQGYLDRLIAALDKAAQAERELNL